MTLSRAIFAGLCFVAAAIIFTYGMPAGAQRPADIGPRPTFELGMPEVTGDTAAMVWRVNRETGQVSICVLDESFISRAPNCSPWSAD